MVYIRSSDKSQESIGEVNLDVSSTSSSDAGPMDDDPLIIGILRAIMSSGRRSEVVSKYGMPPNYVYRILGDDKYVSRLDLLEVAVCEESF